MKPIERLFYKQRIAYVFKAHRRPLRFTVGPAYLAFSVVDYLYLPQYWHEGLVLRIIWYSLVLASVPLLKVKRIRERYSEQISATLNMSACWIIDWLIWRSGGYQSLYVTGLILVNVTGLQLMSFSRRHALIINIGSYLPAVLVILVSAKAEVAFVATVQAAFLLGMLMLTWFYKTAEDKSKAILAKRQSIMFNEVQALRRTEYLKQHFPATLLKQIESGELDLSGKKVHPTAVVGFADISSSTAIANKVNLEIDWLLKENFLACAIKRATENGLIVLSQLGDGCFFLANFNGGNAWPNNIIAFFENLSTDYQNIKSELQLPLERADAGIKFGIAMGPSMVGFIGKGQAYFTANGPDVNLAARLCSEADSGELIVSSRVWHALKQSIKSWDVTDETFELKGFEQPVPAFRIRSRLSVAGGRPTCPLCGGVLMVISNDDHTLDIKCANGHSGDQINGPIPKIA